MKNSNDNIENRTRDLQVCSVVPQPTAPLRASNYYTGWIQIGEGFVRLVIFLFRTCTEIFFTSKQSLEVAICFGIYVGQSS